jgi:hypothetical protein
MVHATVRSSRHTAIVTPLLLLNQEALVVVVVLVVVDLAQTTPQAPGMLMDPPSRPNTNNTTAVR